MALVSNPQHVPITAVHQSVGRDLTDQLLVVHKKRRYRHGVLLFTTLGHFTAIVSPLYAKIRFYQMLKYLDDKNISEPSL